MNENQKQALNARALMTRIMQNPDLPLVQPYFMHFVLNALDRVGLMAEFGIREIQKWMTLLDEHPTSLKESWTFGDYSHAWSGTPTYQLSARVLGITPLSPGFTITSIAPQVGDLKWVKGIIPTPHGLIQGHYETVEHQSIFKISLPNPISGEFLAPIPSSQILKIEYNGLVFPFDSNQTVIKILLPSGNSQIRIIKR